jgi:hypothetical protein
MPSGPTVKGTQIGTFLGWFPTPIQMEFSYPRTWDTENLGFAEGAMQDGGMGALKTAAAEAGQGIAGRVTGAIQKEQGVGINPRAAILFKDLPFREVSFAWSLKPKNQAQAVKWETAIKMLKALSAPMLTQDNSLFDVKHCFFAVEVQNGSRIFFKSPSMVLTNITTNLTPNGFWSQHKDGSPTAVELSISLQETELATMDRLLNQDFV